MNDGEEMRAHVPGDDEIVPRDVIDTLYSIQDVILRHPMPMQAAFRALVAEGRRFSETPEGARMKARLLASPSTARARLFWEMMTTNAFVEKPVHVLPSVFLERLVRVIAVERIEPLLARLFQSGPR